MNPVPSGGCTRESTPVTAESPRDVKRLEAVGVGNRRGSAPRSARTQQHAPLILAAGWANNNSRVLSVNKVPNPWYYCRWAHHGVRFFRARTYTTSSQPASPPWASSGLAPSHATAHTAQRAGWSAGAPRTEGRRRASERTA